MAKVEESDEIITILVKNTQREFREWLVSIKATQKLLVQDLRCYATHVLPCVLSLELERPLPMSGVVLTGVHSRCQE
jgi:hypothetical protein